MEVSMVIATERDILQTLNRHYDSESESVEKFIAELAEDEELKAAGIGIGDGEKFNIADAEALSDSCTRPQAVEHGFAAGD